MFPLIHAVPSIIWRRSLDINMERPAARAFHHDIDHRVIAERERDLAAAVAQFTCYCELRRPLGLMGRTTTSFNSHPSLTVILDGL